MAIFISKAEVIRASVLRIDTLNDMKYLMPLWVMKIKKQGIKKIDGALIGDASIYDDSITPQSWDKDDLGMYYGAGASGLTFHENAFMINFKPGKKYNDSASVVILDPPIPYITIYNNVSTGWTYTPEDLWVGGAPYNNYRIIKGVVPKDTNQYRVRASLPDPAFYCAYTLYKALSVAGIKVTDSCIALKDMKDKERLKTRALTFFYSFESPPLDTLIYYTNQSSINTYAEDILKILAFEKTGIGST